MFLSHCCQGPYPCWESQATSPPQDALQHCADLSTCCGGSSDSNLVLILCVLASKVHSLAQDGFLLSRWSLFCLFSPSPAISILSLTGGHSTPHLPRMPSNTDLVSGPAVWAAHTLILSYACVFLPPMSTAIRTSVFSFVEALSVHLYIT